MYIPRHIEPVVERLARRKPVVVLTGARQVGKSTMLRTICPSVRYITLNNPLVRESSKTNPSLFFQMYEPPVIVDEIQKAAELFEYIKDTVDESNAKGQFFLTGSQSIKLMQNISESLAGRAGIIRLAGLSMREINGRVDRAPYQPDVHPGHADISTESKLDLESFLEIIHRGFFPELYETPGDLHDWLDFYSSYFQSYLEKDIRDMLNIHDESAFIRFVTATAALTGQMLNLSHLAGMCGKDQKTVRTWLSVLESCGIIYLLQPYYNNINKRLIKTPKLIFLDTGLACWLLGWNTPEQLFKGAMWGHIFESYVISEIIKSYYNDGIVRPPLFYYRDKDKNGIDLLIKNGDTLYPVEIKASSDPTRAMVSSFRCLDGIAGMQVGAGSVICLASQRLPLTDKVWILPAHLI
ncbi:MAG: ATP-binding protein [Symbiobacteriaceae bacterium]|nr:ATP-binding protein [Symbiobacteriaceae bacterium]